MEDQDYILFENYLLGNLSKEDINAFELRLETDSKFKESFNTYKELSSFLEHKFENEEASTVFQNNLKNISKTYFEKQESPSKLMRFKPWQYAMAASIALLFGIVLFNNLSDPSYADYANYDSISLTVRGEQDALLKTAENAFNAKDFAKAEAAFKSLLVADKDNAELQFYRAVSNIELNHFEMAENTLTGIAKGQSAYKNKAIWYLALSKLKQEEYHECLEILKTIPEDAEDYKQAQKLIKKLD
ncbi:tol-pal system YbgF family protein [Mariniflexile sp. HNIBRBA6329]|uniref:tetratricopeptide repeat protein n=1 Tax=Mariniflexile sp. HNIBRBA6329 TaxID=3373088 RepID=UPI0037459F6A